MEIITTIKSATSLILLAFPIQTVIPLNYSNIILEKIQIITI